MHRPKFRTDILVIIEDGSELVVGEPSRLDAVDAGEGSWIATYKLVRVQRLQMNPRLTDV